MTNDAGLVSVIIPSYNKGLFLRDAIESVLSQTYRNYEIIIVDDGSQDNTPEVAASFPAIQYIRQDNQGPSGARNTGLRASRGKHLVFLDADDRLLPIALEVGTACLDSHPDCAFVSGHVTIINRDGSVVRAPEESCIDTDHYATLLHYNYIWTPAAVMFRRSAVESVHGFSNSRFGTEDWDIYLRLARIFPVFCHDSLMAEYRIHEGQLSGDSGYMLKESLECLKEQKPFIKGNRKCEEAYRKGIVEVQKYFGEPLVKQIHSSIRSFQWMNATKGLFTLLRYYPQRLVHHAE